MTTEQREQGNEATIERGAATPDPGAMSHEAGRQARKRAPRSSHGEWWPAPNRTEAVEILARQAHSRVPELVPLRYERMLASPFAFYRGAAAIMSADLATTPVSGFDVQACGDAHLSNFGAYAAPDRVLVFDLNDFDETLPGPWEWDVKRLAASIEIAARQNGFRPEAGAGSVAAAARSYREEVRRTAGMGHLDVRYMREDVAELRDRLAASATSKQVARLDRNLDRSRRKDRMRAFSKLTRRVGGELRIISDPPVVVPVDEVFEGEERAMVMDGIQHLFDDYRESLSLPYRRLLGEYRMLDMARKVVGVGSVGTRAWIIFLVGRDEGDPLFLQVKEAQRSVLEEHLRPSEFDNQGQRVVEGQCLTQSTHDIMLGWLRSPGIDGTPRDYYVRQLWDQKGSVDVEALDPSGLTTYAGLCGTTLARAHARCGDRVAIAAYLGKSSVFDDAIGRFATTYADQNQRDYEAALEAKLI